METTTRTLAVKLTDDEVAIRSQELAEAELERLLRTIELESAVEEWKDQKKTFEKDVQQSVAESVRLARIVKYREELREVACAMAVENGQYTLTRTDTGEVVVQRAATTEELQANLFDKTVDAVDDAIEGAMRRGRAEADGTAPQSEQ